MLRCLFIAFIFITHCFWFSEGFAESQNIYKTSLYVQDQSLMLRDKALMTTAIEILSKVSANPNITENPVVQKLLPHASEWVNSYIYEKTASLDSPRPWLFQVSFNAQAIDQIIELSKKNPSSKLNVKTSEKFGPILLWLTVQGLDKKNILIDDTESRFSKLIKEEATAKNISIFFPILDLQEQEKIGHDMAPYLPARSAIFRNFIKISERYEPKFIIFGKINAIEKGNWQSQWRILSKNNEEFWTYSGGSFTEQIHFFTQSLENLSYPPQRNLITTTFPVEIVIKGIDNKISYQKTFYYLKNLLGDIEISPISVTETQVTFKFNSSKPLSDIEKLFKESSFLVKINQNNKSQLTYQLKNDESVT